jgi:electron transport complex protein RnfG
VTNVKKDFIVPLVVLSAICLFVSGALAVTNSITEPVITGAAAERAELARREILPDADGFVLLQAEGLPRTVTEVYGTTNGVGYLFMVTVNGYGGEMRLICGIDPDGAIIRTITLAHTETAGISDPVFNMQYRYAGLDQNLEGIDAVTGATITFNAYRNGILDAFRAFEIVRGLAG